jgi:broad specificity phosphatase PhoE
MDIYVIRHGLSEANQSGLIQGQTDSPLTPTGQEQARLLGRYFESRKIVPDIIYSSPLGRAFTTASLIASQICSGVPVEKHPGLMEIDTGRLSGLSLEEAYVNHPDEFAPDVNRWLEFSAFGGESFEEFFGRVDTAAKSITCDWDLLCARKIMFVVHAGVMRPLLKSLLDARSDFMYYSFGNCTHLKLVYRPARNSVRKIIEYVLRLEQVADLLGTKVPVAIDGLSTKL